MRLVERRAPQSSRLSAVEHVIVDVPHGRQRELIAFYEEFLRLPRLHPDADERGALVFGRPGLRLELRPVERPRIEPFRRRLTVRVDSLAECREWLESAGRRYLMVSGLAFTNRCLLVADPCANLIELRQDWDHWRPTAGRVRLARNA